MVENVTPIYPEGREERFPVSPKMATHLTRQPALSGEMLSVAENATAREVVAAMAVLTQALDALLGCSCHFRTALAAAAHKTDDMGARAIVRTLAAALAPDPDD